MNYFLKLGVISTIFMGPWGFFGTIFAYIAALLMPKQNLSEAYAQKILKKRETTSDVAVSLAKLNYKQTQRLSDRLDILSYKEILASNDEFKKINLIGMISFNPTKENVSLVRGALTDEIEMVRILASTSLQKMDASFVSKILELKESKEAFTSLGAEESQSYYLTMAQVYDDYVYTGLIAKENEEFYISGMLSCYKEGYYAAKNEEAMKKYIRALVRFDRLQEAKELCDEYLQIKPQDYGMQFWMAEIYFKQREFAALNALLESVPKDHIEFEPYKKSVAWWLDGR